MTADNHAEWLHFKAHAQKRKRAELVCVTCHSKKIKCDIQVRKTRGHETCSNCSLGARDCRIRASKRDKRRRSAKHRDSRDDDREESDLVENPPPAQASDSIDGLLAADASFQTLHTSPLAPTSTIDSNVNDKGPSPSASRHAHFVNFQRPNNTLIGQSPAQWSQASDPHTETAETQMGDVDAGFIQVYGPENQFDAENQAFAAQLEQRFSSDVHPDLQHIFIETYFEYCYTWCPVLDRETLVDEVTRSPLLSNALALASCHIQPPLLPHDRPETYYRKARTIFYDDEEADLITSLKAVSLFYWWAPQSPSRVHRHSSWWWTSVLIRHMQQMNIHREPGPDNPRRETVNLSIRRRLWWTAFARECLTSLCQSKPCIIDPSDCKISEPTLADFPSDSQSQRKGEIFIYWVRLCAIIGRIAKFLLRSSTSDKSQSRPFPDELREELVSWIHSLPRHLQLPIGSGRTNNFDKDVHQLHLPYLTTIIILHLKRSGGHLPQALPPAILAASCTARILKDVLSRGNARYLMAITCWHSGTAFIALLQACRIPHLAKFANEDLDILQHTVKQLQTMWATAHVIAGGFDRLLKTVSRPSPYVQQNLHAQPNSQSLYPDTSPTYTHSALSAQPDDQFNWLRFFPFVTKSTNGIAESLIEGREHGTVTRGFPSPNNEGFHDLLLSQYQNLFDPFMMENNPGFMAEGMTFGV